MNKHSTYQPLHIWTGPADESYQKQYGSEILITRMGKITIVHTDRPSKDVIRRRIDEVLHEEKSTATHLTMTAPSARILKTALTM